MSKFIIKEQYWSEEKGYYHDTTATFDDYKTALKEAKRLIAWNHVEVYIKEIANGVVKNRFYYHK